MLILSKLNKMKKIYITLVLFIITVSFSYSQVSGYMGKRNVLKVGVFLKNSFVFPNRNGENGFMSFNDKYSFEFERVINRKQSLLLHASYFQTKLSFKDVDGKPSRLISDGFSNYELTYPSEEYMPEMDGFGFGIDYRIYKTSHLAPLGAYVSFGVDYFLLDAVINKIEYYQLEDYENPDNLSMPESQRGVFGVNMKWGTQQVFFDKITFESSFHLGFLFAGIGKEFDYSYSGGLVQTENNDFLKYQMARRMFAHYLWGVTFSVGYLF